NNAGNMGAMPMAIHVIRFIIFIDASVIPTADPPGKERMRGIDAGIDHGNAHPLPLHLPVDLVEGDLAQIPAIPSLEWQWNHRCHEGRRRHAWPVERDVEVNLKRLNF